MISAILGALAFGCFVYLTTGLFEARGETSDRFRTLGAEALRIALCAAAAVAGGTLLAHAAAPDTIFALAILCAALGTTCFLATLECPVPAVVPGTALAVLIGVALLHRDPGPLMSACVTSAPFAATVLFARGSGADWHDAVVGALGGAVFGIALGLVVGGFSCIALALARPYLARRRARPQPPVRFSSALAGTFMVVLVGQLAIS